jgi:hypothetical protein
MIRACAIALATALAPAAAGPAPSQQVAQATRCFALPDSRVIGDQRICYYRCGPTTVTAVTIKATELCPMFIDR